MIVQQQTNPNSLMGQFVANKWVKDYTAIQGSKMKTVVAKFQDNAAGYRLKMPFDPVLTKSRITAIEVVNSTTANLNPLITDPSSGDFYPNLSTAELAVCVFVFARGDEQLAILPAVAAIPEQNGGKIQSTDITEHIWSDCYVEVVQSGVLTTSTAVFTINVWYEEM